MLEALHKGVKDGLVTICRLARNLEATVDPPDSRPSSALVGLAALHLEEHVAQVLALALLEEHREVYKIPLLPEAGCMLLQDIGLS